MADLASHPDQGVVATGPALVGGERAGSRQSQHELTHAADAPDGTDIDFRSDLVTLGQIKQKIGNYTEAEELFNSALEKVELEEAPDHPDVVPALGGLIANRILRGSLDGAEPLVERLVNIAQNVGDDGEIVLVLNDLVRLCLSESAYELAEPLLICLLDIKRSKGEERPEVATVLASLAVVRQALGQHESAEELWRQVVEIRERTLAPNHFAITSALEHLAGACAARGKVGEALQLFQRAHTLRALTLGAEHRSLRFSRERIADLQLQAQELADLEPRTDADLQLQAQELADLETRTDADLQLQAQELPDLETRTDTTSTPEAGRGSIAKLHDFGSAAPMPAPPDAPYSATTTLPLEREVSPQPTIEDSPRGSATVIATRDVAVSRRAGARYRDFFLSIRHELDSRDVALSRRAEVLYSDIILSIRHELDITEEDSLVNRVTAMIAAAREWLRKRYIAVLAGLGAIALLLVAQAASSRVLSERGLKTSDAGSARSESRPARRVPSRAVSRPAVTATTASNVAGIAETRPSTSTAGAETSVNEVARGEKVTTPRSAARDESARAKKERKTTADREEVSIPTPCRKSSSVGRTCVAKDIAVRVDSIAGRAAALTIPAVETQMVALSFSAERSRPQSPDYLAAGTPPVGPRLIGPMPALGYPIQLTDHDGEVRVRFSVDTNGRPVMSTFRVVKSSDPLFTAAVRNAVPRMRFQPAMSGGVEPKPTVEAVEIPFRFTRPGK